MKKEYLRLRANPIELFPNWRLFFNHPKHGAPLLAVIRETKQSIVLVGAIYSNGLASWLG
jgi:hypothetical protein